MSVARSRTREAYRTIFPGWTPMNEPTHCSSMLSWVRKYAASVSRPAWMITGGTPPLARSGLLEAVDVEVDVGVQFGVLGVVEDDTLVFRRLEGVPRLAVLGDLDDADVHHVLPAEPVVGCRLGARHGCLADGHPYERGYWGYVRL